MISICHPAGAGSYRSLHPVPASGTPPAARGLGALLTQPNG